MTDKLMLTSNDVTQNYSFCRLQLVNTQLNESINQNLIKVPKVQRIRKRYHKTFVTSVMNSPIFPPSLPYSADMINKDDNIYILHK